MTKLNKTLLTCLLAGATLVPLTSVQVWWGPGYGRGYGDYYGDYYRYPYYGWGGYPGYGWGAPYAAPAAPQRQQGSTQPSNK